jgi:hypothetical protein
MLDLNHFILTGNAITGTSLTCSLLNQHPQITCHHEWHFARDQYQSWFEARDESECIWGNKQPIEQMCNNGWDASSLAGLAGSWHIINIYRKYMSYAKRFEKRMRGICNYKGKRQDDSKFWWDLNNSIYDAQKEFEPARVIRLCFEDLVIAPERELRRVFDFLGAKVTKKILENCILKAPHKIGFGKKHNTILPEKAWS